MNPRWSIAATESSSWATLDAPMSADVTRGSRSAHARAIWASVCPRRRGDLVQRADPCEHVVGEELGRERGRATGPRALGNPVQVLVREHSLGERREDDAADAQLAECVEQVGLDPAIEHRVRGLVDQERRAQLAEDRGSLSRLLGRVRGNPDVEGLPLPNRSVERAHRLLERRVRVESVRVEDVDVVETHPQEALVEAREQVLPRPAVSVRTRPHVVAGLARDDELVAIRPEITLKEPTEVLLGRAVRRPVVVGEVEVRDPEVERASDDRATRLERTVVAEVPPEPERDRRKVEAASAGAAIAASGRSGRLRGRTSRAETIPRRPQARAPLRCRDADPRDPGRGQRAARRRC